MTFTPTEPARQQTEGGRILVGICSCRSNRDKRDAVRETWLSIPAPGIDCRFFVGGGTPVGDEPDVIVLPVNDDYEHLPSKVRAFFAEALATSDFDWLFKCDDDTYVALERLRGVIDGVHELVGNEFIQSRGFPSGGAGYLLSRRLVRILADDVTLPGTGAEDVSIGRAAISHGASAIGLPCLCWDRSRSPLPGNYVVTSHWCAPEQLRVAHAMLHECPNEIEAVHPSWSDRLWLYPSGFFSRCSTSCRGRWSKGDQGVLHLKWFDWGAETFAPSGRFFHKVEPIRSPSPPPGSSPADKTIFIHAAGRTGNQIFQFAYGLHLQRKFGCLLRGNLRLLSGVPGIPGDVTHGEPSGPTVTICDVDDDAVARCLNNPLMAGAELHGFFQSAGHLEDGWGELRAILGDVSKQDAIGVHVRRGDYLRTAHDMNLPASYYLTGVRQVIADHPYDYRGITVFSDDPAWCVAHLLADLREILPAKVFSGSELETLREMKAMRGMVITNSTFSWWGAWLADCPTMYPQTWPVPGGSLRPGLGCSRPHWKPNIDPEIQLRNERIAKELVGTWDQYNDGVYCCQKTFFADGRVCYGASWAVEYDGTIRFGDHMVRLTPEGELAGATCHQVQLHYLRSSGPPGAARTNPDVLHEMVCLEVDRANPIDMLAHLVETGVTAELVRYGPDSDGGYHVPFGIDYNKVLTIGVGQDIRFETHYARSHPGAEFVLFDHTVSGLPEALSNSVFHRIGVGYGEACKPLPELLEGRITATDTVLLKMDCEGGEWDCGMEHMSFDGIHTLVLEIHDTLRPADPAQAARVLAAVADHFILVHACPNNCSAAGTVQGHLLTNCVELTLVNRRHAAGLPP